ncbi:hypothetical protein L3Q72_23275 [Vibrio sp. JC009]|uniref:hypothetical protein n=1 Tax=Vibrio sp. JC009 TaxID=2912314 RepID=UPI0023B127F9|nr:hypothetical protein [Vibrio sp. JC009]WED24155.1 hypothetical protein L3Q72_23275 [Vibrio sp. JC009]
MINKIRNKLLNLSSKNHVVIDIVTKDHISGTVKYTNKKFIQFLIDSGAKEYSHDVVLNYSDQERVRFSIPYSMKGNTVFVTCRDYRFKAKYDKRTHVNFSIDSINKNVISGWAFDCDEETNDVISSILIDGKIPEYILEYIERADINSILELNNCKLGFNITVSPKFLNVGKNKVTIMFKSGSSFDADIEISPDDYLRLELLYKRTNESLFRNKVQEQIDEIYDEIVNTDISGSDLEKTISTLIIKVAEINAKLS